MIGYAEVAITTFVLGVLYDVRVKGNEFSEVSFKWALIAFFWPVSLFKVTLPWWEPYFVKYESGLRARANLAKKEIKCHIREHHSWK